MWIFLLLFIILVGAIKNMAISLKKLLSQIRISLLLQYQKQMEWISLLCPIGAFI